MTLTQHFLGYRRIKIALGPLPIKARLVEIYQNNDKINNYRIKNYFSEPADGATLPVALEEITHCCMACAKACTKFCGKGCKFN